jgi:hypothetical protein
MTVEAMATAVVEDGEAPVGRLAELLGDAGGFREAGMRVGAGLAMSAAFGLALGARDGGPGLIVHAVGVAAAPAGVIAFGVPSLYIVLALFDAPVTALGLARSAGRGAAALGMVLAGLAPLTALYGVSADDGLWGAIAGLVALMLGGFVGLSQFHGSLRDQLASAPLATRSAMMAAAAIFGLFATVASARIWFALVPSFGGGL